MILFDLAKSALQTYASLYLVTNNKIYKNVYSSLKSKDPNIFFKTNDEFREYNELFCYKDSPFYKNSAYAELKCTTTNVALYTSELIENTYNYTSSLFDFTE